MGADPGPTGGRLQLGASLPQNHPGFRWKVQCHDGHEGPRERSRHAAGNPES
jgi:hypothetical protein